MVLLTNANNMWDGSSPDFCPGSCPAPDLQADAIGEQKPEWIRSAAAKADAIGEQQVKQMQSGFISNETVDCLLRFDATVSILNYC